MIEGNRRETIPLKIFSASGSAKDSITRQWYHLTIPSSRGLGGLPIQICLIIVLVLTIERLVGISNIIR
jgi:hypothetical protein